MTKKDFEILAAAFNRELSSERMMADAHTGIRKAEHDAKGNGISGAVFAVAHALSQEFPRFDRDRFTTACFKDLEAYR